METLKHDIESTSQPVEEKPMDTDELFFDQNTEAGKRAAEDVRLVHEQKIARDSDIKEYTTLRTKIRGLYGISDIALAKLQKADFTEIDQEITQLQLSLHLSREEKSILDQDRVLLKSAENMTNLVSQAQKTGDEISQVVQSLPSKPTFDTLHSIICSIAQVEFGFNLFLSAFPNLPLKAIIGSLKRDLKDLLGHQEIQSEVYTEPLLSTISAYRAKEKPDILQKYTDTRNQVYIIRDFLNLETLIDPAQKQLHQILDRAAGYEAQRMFERATIEYENYIKVIAKFSKVNPEILERIASISLLDDLVVPKQPNKLITFIAELLSTTDERKIMAYSTLLQDYRDAVDQANPEEKEALMRQGESIHDLVLLQKTLAQFKNFTDILTMAQGTALMPNDQKEYQRLLQTGRLLAKKFPHLSLQDIYLDPLQVLYQKTTSIII